MLGLTDLAVTAAEALDYVAARGLAGWPEDEPAQLAALRRGQDWLAGAYDGRWAEAWTEPPLAVKYAVIEAAIAEAREPGILSRQLDPERRVVSESVDGASVTFAKAEGQFRLPAVERLLHPHLAAPPPFLVI